MPNRAPHPLRLESFDPRVQPSRTGTSVVPAVADHAASITTPAAVPSLEFVRPTPASDGSATHGQSAAKSETAPNAPQSGGQSGNHGQGNANANATVPASINSPTTPMPAANGKADPGPSQAHTAANAGNGQSQHVDTTPVAGASSNAHSQPQAPHGNANGPGNGNDAQQGNGPSAANGNGAASSTAAGQSEKQNNGNAAVAQSDQTPGNAKSQAAQDAAHGQPPQANGNAYGSDPSHAQSNGNANGVDASHTTSNDNGNAYAYGASQSQAEPHGQPQAQPDGPGKSEQVASKDKVAGQSNADRGNGQANGVGNGNGQGNGGAVVPSAGSDRPSLSHGLSPSTVTPKAGADHPADATEEVVQSTSSVEAPTTAAFGAGGLGAALAGGSVPVFLAGQYAPAAAGAALSVSAAGTSAVVTAPAVARNAAETALSSPSEEGTAIAAGDAAVSATGAQSHGSQSHDGPGGAGEGEIDAGSPLGVVSASAGVAGSASQDAVVSPVLPPAPYVVEPPAAEPVPESAEGWLEFFGTPLASGLPLDVAEVGQWANEFFAYLDLPAPGKKMSAEAYAWLAGAVMLTGGIGAGVLSRPRRRWQFAGTPGLDPILARWDERNGIDAE